MCAVDAVDLPRLVRPCDSLQRRNAVIVQIRAGMARRRAPVHLQRWTTTQPRSRDLRQAMRL
jgi:PhoPQ-activated pathogenicity-related protein